MTGSFFNSLDYFYISLTLVSCLIGFFRGFVKDFFHTCSWLGSGFASAFVSPYFAHHLQEKGIISGPTTAKIIAIVLSFTIVLIALQLTVNLVSKTVKNTMFLGLDRAFGALYGFVRGLIILVIICICAIMFNIFNFNRGFVANSKITPILITVTDYLMPKVISVSWIKTKVPPSQTQTDKRKFVKHGAAENELSKEDIGEMERLSREQIRKDKEAQYQQTKNQKTKIEETESYLSGLVSKFFGKEDTQTRTQSPQARQLHKFPKVKNKEDDVQFGCMDLMKARAKRKAQKKAERIKRALLKRLDNEP